MSTATSSGNNSVLFSPRVALVLVLVSALSALAFLVLSAYAPDLRSDSTGGTSALSRSAVGFGGLRSLLEALGTTTTVDRVPPDAHEHSLLILTPTPASLAKDLTALAMPGARLVILPKWVVVPDPLHAGWVQKVAPIAVSDIAPLLNALTKDAKLTRGKAAAPVTLRGLYRRFDPRPVKVPVDTLQTIAGPTLEPDIVDADGRAVLVQIRGTETYILSDPDLANNAALHDVLRARIALTIVNALRVGNGPVSFDVTLDGFRRSPDLLRTVFAPPFLGATLCVLLAAALLGLHAMSRFGSPRPPARALAFGKAALAENTAALIRLTHREPRMAPRYADAVRNQVAAFFGLLPERMADGATMRSLERHGPASEPFEALRAAAQDVTDERALMQVSGRLYRWARGITHGHF